MPELQSSHLKACEHDAASGDLTIEFQDGAKHTFAGVPRQVYAGLLSAPSPGSFFRRHIKGQYRSSKAGGDDAEAADH